MDVRTRHIGRRRAALAGLVLSLFVVVLPAFGDTPESGPDPNVTLTVTPDDLLADGQTVMVTGTGFPPNTAGTIRQCGVVAGVPQCDADVAATFTTGPSGEIPPTAVVVTRIVDTGTTTFNCGVQACVLVATAGDRSSQHGVRILGAGTLLPSSTTATSSTVPATTTTSTSSTVPSLCAAVQAILEPFPFLGSFLDALLGLIGCPATG